MAQRPLPIFKLTSQLLISPQNHWISKIPSSSNQPSTLDNNAIQLLDIAIQPLDNPDVRSPSSSDQTNTSDSSVTSARIPDVMDGPPVLTPQTVIELNEQIRK
jgi:hypothetical protein